MPSDDAFSWDQPGPRRAPGPSNGRIDLRTASARFGVSVATLRKWCKRQEVDAIKERHPGGVRWMVDSASLADRVESHELPTRAAKPDVAAGPEADNTSMLVPRDAWDKIMSQLGNLHEAGQQLAEARERAAKAETEALFLRDRLAEVRAERDLLRADPAPSRAPQQEEGPAARAPQRSDMGRRLRGWVRRLRP